LIVSTLNNVCWIWGAPETLATNGKQV
jgi:hypothetical protein